METVAWRPLLIGSVATGWATAHAMRLGSGAEIRGRGSAIARNQYRRGAAGTAPGARLNARRGAAWCARHRFAATAANHPRRNDEERLSLSDLKSLLANSPSAADPAS
jgi:hypothetical protein